MPISIYPAPTQSVTISSGALATNAAQESGGNLTQQAYVLSLILSELRTITQFLQVGLNVQDDPAVVRADFVNGPPQ